MLTARRKGLFFPALPRAVLSARGKDRTSFLHRLLSNDIKGLQPGQAKPACLLDRQGKVLFACLAHAGQEEILLEMAPFHLEIARAALEKYRVSEQVDLQDATARFQVLSAHGPALPAAALPPLAGTDGFPFPIPLFGMPGMDFWIDSARAAEIGPKLQEAFRAAGMEEGDLQAFEVLRIEAGLPVPGKELTPEVILNELGREDFVSFTKGCYVGQEIVARIKHRAHPPRLLTGFLLESGPLPPEGSSLLHEGKPVGTLTSICFSPTLKRNIALGFLQYGFTGEIAGAEKTALPFVKP